jgi:signal transduction histidine kinase/ActR/RegA family two-component response regulator
MTASSPQPLPGGNPGKMHLNWFSLRFSGPMAMLEEPFQRDDVARSLVQVRIALLMGALTYGLFGILDWLVLPLYKQTTWLIRYGFVCPAILASLAVTYIPRLHPYLQPILSFLITLGCLGIVLMIPIAPFYYPGIILVFIFGYAFIDLRFLWASLSGWITVILYEMVSFFIGTPAMELISSSFFLISANIAGMLVSYAIEYSSRRNFFLLRLLDLEQRKIQDVNEQLEQRVAERTESLERMTRQLLQEMSERKSAEQERRRLEEQLKQAEKMEVIGKLASGVAHDLNNILSGVVAYPDLLLLDLPEESPLRDSLLIIKQSGEKAAAVVQDMLTLSRQGMAEKKVINLNKIINDYLYSPEYQQLRSGLPRVRLEVDLQEDLLNVKGAPVHLAKALMNLVNNAFEANLVDGAVAISTRNGYLDQPREGYEKISEGEYVILTVSDTGIGIDAGDLTKIFEPFFTKKKLGRSGTGLGMTLIWSTVKDHGGFLDIRSAEGRGTTFDVYFPATREEMSAEGPLVTLEDCRGTESVLVVDDVPEQREIATMMLRKLGYAVHAVASGEAAVEYLQERNVDILVLDMIMLPGIDGCETYNRIIKDHPGQKAIIASGFSETERVKEAQGLGAGEYIKKPYTLDKIARALRSELDRRPS